MCCKTNLLDKMHEIAELRGGECLSTEYISKTMKLFWKCNQGHIWEASSQTITNWCPVCKSLNSKQYQLPREQRSLYTLEDMKKFAIDKGGECLSSVYLGADISLRWQCSKKHVWKETPRKAKRLGSWCPVCNPVIRNAKRPRVIGNREFIPLHST